MIKKVIIDCDPGIDDSLALIYLLKNPKIKVLGINISSGNCSNIQGVKNILALFKKFNFSYIPPIFTVRGLHVNSENNYTDTPETHGKDGLGETYFSNEIDEKDLEKVNYNFNEWMNKVLNEEKDIYFLALGPLTSLSDFINLYPQDIGKIKRIISMGGVLWIPGNTTPFAEWNYYWDPIAVKNVFDFLNDNNLKNLLIVPQDVTSKIVWTPNISEMLRRLVKSKEDQKSLSTMLDLLSFYDEFHWKYEKRIGSVINDPLAATVLILEDDYDFSRLLSVDMIIEGEEKGRLLSHKKDRKEVVRIMYDVYPRLFWFEFLKTTFSSIEQDSLLDQLRKIGV